METSGIDLNFSETTDQGNFVDRYSRNLNSSRLNEEEGNNTNSGQAGSQVFPNATEIGHVVASQVWQSGTEKAKKYASIYGNIDILRPYFDVEPRTVLIRLARAFVPVVQKSKHVEFPRELYGPSMLNFTLVALLLYSMKSASHTIQDGTLIGTAMCVCFGYWFAVSAIVFFTAYIANSTLSFIQVLSFTGYALVAPCVIVLLSAIFHPVHDHLFFYLLWLFIGGLTAARLATAFASRAEDSTHRVTLMAVSASLHMLFMLYLHFAYHSTAEQINSIAIQIQ